MMDAFPKPNIHPSILQSGVHGPRKRFVTVKKSALPPLQSASKFRQKLVAKRALLLF
jgi:hypothetical protein